MVYLLNKLSLERCPYCSIAKPNLSLVFGRHETRAYNGKNLRYWVVYQCDNCGGLVLAESKQKEGLVEKFYPEQTKIDDTLPERARDFLQQAIESIHAPSGAIMLAASAVDAMLKEKGYNEGTLNNRIDQASENHLITSEMADWAHDIRLDANIERHSDLNYSMPSPDDSEKSINFALALAEFLFVLPARVERGRNPISDENGN